MGLRLLIGRPQGRLAVQGLSQDLARFEGQHPPVRYADLVAVWGLRPLLDFFSLTTKFRTRNLDLLSLGQQSFMISKTDSTIRAESFLEKLNFS
jgi:hypothetical protein